MGVLVTRKVISVTMVLECGHTHMTPGTGDATSYLPTGVVPCDACTFIAENKLNEVIPIPKPATP